ncbi:MAG TPA: sigma-70 family RNA polymerase sigma factor [Gemmatimonadota bacterium]|nr:sigma-70 family RNA polymerase sigma factor [Gemmatimonadota bacterium]
MTSSSRHEEIPDGALIERCLAGDEAAWAILVRRYANLVHGIAARFGLGADEAADAFQAVFVIVWRNLDLLKEPQAFPGWLATIARREALRMARGMARRVRNEERMGADPTARVIPTSAPRADEAVEGAERAALVGHAVERMDARCRELLTLLFWETPSPSYDEAAARLGMPIGSLGPTRGRCLEKLRAALAELGFG